MNSEEYNLPTNIVDVAAIKAVIDNDKENELKLAPHLPREALDLGNYYINMYVINSNTEFNSRQG